MTPTPTPTSTAPQPSLARHTSMITEYSRTHMTGIFRDHGNAPAREAVR
jgi:hypothetical protein